MPAPANYAKNPGMPKPFCPKCGERDKLAPHAEYWSADHDGKGNITSFHPGPGREGMKLTGKTECRNCNHVF